jgi:Hypothetical protein (DUF2513)
MKRDWDVIRTVLMEIEALDGDARADFSYSMDNDSSNIKEEHAFLLWKSGFIDADEINTASDQSIYSPRLTWSGHDLLNTLRSTPVWERVKKNAKEKGLELTFDTVKLLAKEALEYLIKSP